MDPPLGCVSCCLLLMAGGPVSLKFTAQPDARPDTDTYLDNATIASRALHCTLRRVSRAPAQTRYLGIALQSLFCTGVMSCHIQAESHAFEHHCDTL